MLAIAARKGVYQALHALALGGPLPFADGTFAGVVSSGVFTTGHVGAEALDELIRITRAGGPLVITVKDTMWFGGFSERIAALQTDGRIALVEETPPYISMPGEQGTTPARAVVLIVK